MSIAPPIVVIVTIVSDVTRVIAIIIFPWCRFVRLQRDGIIGSNFSTIDYHSIARVLCFCRSVNIRKIYKPKTFRSLGLSVYYHCYFLDVTVLSKYVLYGFLCR